MYDISTKTHSQHKVGHFNLTLYLINICCLLFCEKYRLVSYYIFLHGNFYLKLYKYFLYLLLNCLIMLKNENTDLEMCLKLF